MQPSSPLHHRPLLAATAIAALIATAAPLGARAPLAQGQRVPMTRDASTSAPSPYPTRGGPVGTGGGADASTYTLRPGPVIPGTLTPASMDVFLPGPTAEQPFGGDGAILTKRMEVLASVPSGDWLGLGAFTADNWIREDLVAGNGVIAGTSGGARHLRAAASGNIDDDPEQELVAVDFNAPSGFVSILRADKTPGGDIEWSTWFDVPHGGIRGDASISLGDFDGDLHDEVALVLNDKPFNQTGNTSWFRVFDDPAQGGTVMADYERTYEHSSMWALPADLDGDGIDELVLGREGNAGDPGEFEARVYVGGPGVTTLDLHTYYTQISAPSSAPWEAFSGRFLILDFDGDGIDEIAYVGIYGVKEYSLGGLTIPDFLAPDAPANRLDILRGEA